MHLAILPLIVYLILHNFLFVSTLPAPDTADTADTVESTEFGSRVKYPARVSIITEFPPKTWLENLGVRSNGQIIFGELSSPILYHIDPLSGRPPVILAKIPNVLGLLGIAEGKEDRFYFVAGNWSSVTFQTTPGSYSVWEADLRSLRIDQKGTIVSPAGICKVANIPGGQFLNGLTALDADKGLFLIADSVAGVVWRFDINTGSSQVIQKNAFMDPVAGLPNPGINGVKLYQAGKKAFLYFTNSARALLVRVPINRDGTSAGDYQIINGTSESDDLVLDQQGSAYICQEMSDIAKVDLDGSYTLVTRNSTTAPIQDPTAAQFGRAPQDKDSIYVVTTGGIACYATGACSHKSGLYRVDVHDIAEQFEW